MADCIPWDEFEIKYAELFPSGTGNVAKPLRMALGALIIQTKFQFSHRELVEQITENPFLQYFIVLSGYEYLLAHKEDGKNDNTPPSAEGSRAPDIAKEDVNKGTLTLDVTCAPANIRYPQDISLLKEAMETLEAIIYRFCRSYGLPLQRRYRRRARKDYLAYAKSRKHSTEKIRRTLRKQLGYVGRDIRYMDGFMSRGYAMTDKEINLYLTILTPYEQQKYMYNNKVHSVNHRIVSISQPWLRPIVKGKSKAPA